MLEKNEWNELKYNRYEMVLDTIVCIQVLPYKIMTCLIYLNWNICLKFVNIFTKLDIR